MNNLKKFLKYILAFTVPFVVTAAAFGLVWFQYLTEVPSKSESYYLNDRYDSLTQPLSDGRVFTQEFTCYTSMYGIGLNFNVVDLSLDGEMKIKLTDKTDGAVLMDYTGNLAPVQQHGYTCFTLDKPITENGTRNYMLEISVKYHTPQVSSGQMLSLRKSSNPHEIFGKLTENGKTAEGSLAVMVVKDMLGTAPVKYFAFGGMVASVAAGLIMLALAAFPKKKIVAVFLTVLSVCTLYQIAMPVFSSPDEETHYNTAYALSDKMFGIEFDTGDSLLPKRVTDDDRMIADYRTSAFTYRHIRENFTFEKIRQEDARLTDVVSHRLPGFMMPYYGPALAISGARLAGLNGVVTPLLARFVNLIIFAVAVTMAWYITPTAKNGLLAVALLPMTIHIGTSLSYDSFILSCSMLLTALVLNCAFCPDKANYKKLAALAVLAVIISPAKVIYAILALMVFCIPNSKFKTNNFGWLYKFGIIAAAGAAVLYFNRQRLGLSFDIFVKASARTLEVIADTPVPLGTATFTVGYMLAHPGVMFKLITNTFFSKFTYYFGTVFGASLGYLNLAEVKINPVIIAAFVLMMLICFIPHKDDKIMNIWQRVICVISFLGILAATVGLCLMWTPLDYDFIWGFQGRYLLPAMMPLVMALQSKSLTFNKDITNIAVYGLFSLNILAVLNTFIVIFSR